MWRAADGVLHTVALPRPGEIFSAAALEAVDQLLDAVDDKDLAGLVERRQLVEYDYWALQPVDEAAEAPFVALPPPIGLFDRRVASLPELEVALAEVDLRWRLDVVLALEDWIGAD